MPTPPPRAFNVSYNGIANVLKTELSISIAFDPFKTDPHPPAKKYMGIWDTGATGMVITQKVIDELNLQPIGRVKVYHA